MGGAALGESGSAGISIEGLGFGVEADAFRLKGLGGFCCGSRAVIPLEVTMTVAA
jgi:hypothetical protein